MQPSNNEKQEYGGFIFSRNDSPGALFATPAVALPFNPDGRTVTLGAPPTFDGYTAVAYYHTHPGLGLYAGDDLQVGTNNHFSPDDLVYASTYHLDAYVAVNHFVADNFSTTLLFRADQAGNETALGNLSAKGC